MMVARFAPDTRAIVKKAEDEAQARRSPCIEAEHLLLALSDQQDTEARQILESVGLSREGVERSLDREFQASLLAAGVTVTAMDFQSSTPKPRLGLRFSASAKTALARTVAAASGARQIRTTHLLLGILGAKIGTVPRALQLAGVDQSELVARVQKVLDP